MTYKSLAIISLFFMPQLCDAQDTTLAAEQNLSQNGVCLFTGTPPAEYTHTTLKKLKYGKGSYGSVNDLLPKLVNDVVSVNGDAVINYNGAQRFGFFPWRFVRPVVTGIVIKWSPARDVDCTSAGGHYTTGKLAEAPPPPQK